MSFADRVKRIWRSPLFFRLLVLLVALSSFTTASFAWLGMHDENKSQDMNLGVEYDKFFVEQAYYKYNAKSQSVEKHSELTDMRFNQYDLVFRSRNRYTPIIATLLLTGEDLDKDGGTITIQIERDPTISSFVTENGSKRLSQYFSSIMRVTAMINREYYNPSADTLFNNVDSSNYTTIRAYTGNNTNSKVFTNATVDGNTLTTVEKGNISISVTYGSNDFNTIDGEETLVVYLYITYDEGFNGSNYLGLVGTYQATSESLSVGASGSLDDNAITFSNDLVAIKVSHS